MIRITRRKKENDGDKEGDHDGDNDDDGDNDGDNDDKFGIGGVERFIDNKKKGCR